ncbi:MULTISPECIES: hypothetical protein [Raoultella]|nr:MULTISPECIES: hypothetical protein [Raoultella]MDM9678086.1 hypothetical protein [Raoultella planticola]VTN01879.1 Uncharacterised protein [Raoultella planticola]
MTTDHFTFHITDESDASDKPYFTPEAPKAISRSPDQVNKRY